MPIIQAEATLRPDRSQRTQSSDCDHRFRGLHEDAVPTCDYCEIELDDYLAELRRQQEAAIVWIQHDCPFTREEILADLVKK